MDEFFYENSLKALRDIQTTPLQDIKLPKFKLLQGGEVFFDHLLKEIDKAKEKIWITNYTLCDDEISKKYLNKLINAQERGVDIILFVDSLTSTPDMNLLQTLSDKGGKVLFRNKQQQIVNTLTRSYLQRDHEKIFLTERCLIMGSANIAKEYGGETHGNNFFYDLNVKAKNIVVDDIMEFFVYLSSTGGIKKQDREAILQYQKEFNEIYKPSPFKEDYQVLRIFHPYFDEIQNSILITIRNAQKSIKIINPYYLPLQVLEKELIDANARGVEIQFLTSKNRDVEAYLYYSNNYLFKKLGINGIEVYQYPLQYLHAKAMIVDNQIVNIGSLNMDSYSWYGNNEMNLEIRNDKNFVNQCLLEFEKLKSVSEIVEFINPQNQTNIERLSDFFMDLVHRLMFRRNYYASFKQRKEHFDEQLMLIKYLNNNKIVICFI